LAILEPTGKISFKLNGMLCPSSSSDVLVDYIKLVYLCQNLSSKVTLIHNFWTTKGNHHAFMGISVAYVTNNWDFKISHLGLKYIASNHKGKLLAIPFANVLSKSNLVNKISSLFYLVFIGQKTRTQANFGLLCCINTYWLRQPTPDPTTLQWHPRSTGLSSTRQELT
jgi:hypothetical protein